MAMHLTSPGFRRRALALYIWGALISCLLSAPAFSAQEVAEVLIPTKLEPTQALGLLISPNGVQQIANTEMIKSEKGELIVAVPYDEDKTLPGTLVTAMVFGKSGAFAFGAMRELPPKGVRPAPAEMPLCPEEPAGPELTHAMTSIQKLVEIRGKLVETNQHRVVGMLNEELLNKLKKLERGFGLEREQELSPHMDPFLLVDRLDRILNALKTYSFFKPAEEEEN